MANRTRIYVAFDADSDIRYYRLLQAWDQNSRTDFDFLDAHDLNNIMSWSQEATIKQNLLERLARTKLLILLVGEKTRFLYKFVKWELEYAIRNKVPIIAVNLNGVKDIDEERCPPIIKDELALHIPFNMKVLDRAINEWPQIWDGYAKKGELGPRKYSQSVYQSLGQ